MKPWPSQILSWLLRLIVFPVTVLLVLNAASRFMDGRAVGFVFAIIVINLIVSQFESDSRRIAVLEEKINDLRRGLSKTED